ncbi:MAG: hypothetical protein Q9221_007853 [Calogaya cf. arnoldii]
MQLVKILIAVAAALCQFINATALPAEVVTFKHVDVVVEGPFPINSTSQAHFSDAADVLSKRKDECWNGYSSNADITTLAWQLQNDSPFELEYVGAGNYKSWTYASARFCVYNRKLFDNTRVRRWDVGWGALQVQNNCCDKSASLCRGGKVNIRGNDRTEVNVGVRPAADGC